jgi:hypothetical protein
LIQQGGVDLLTRSELLGSLSLVFWALIFLTVKYDLIVMRADHRGEGGTFALLSLLKGYTGKVFAGGAISFLVVCAAGLLAADGIITPPVSMLGAFEPLGVPVSIILTLVCLVILFKMQWRGTSKVGSIFGWFMIAVWFPWIALKGLPWVVAHPDVFLAINPAYAIGFLASFQKIGALVILGVVVLAITGGEAKYADICVSVLANQQPYMVSGIFDLSVFWSGQKTVIPVHYSLWMAEGGCAKVASANVETVFSGASRISMKSHCLGPQILSDYAFLQYKYKYDWLHPKLEEIVAAYMKLYGKVA